MNNAHDQRRTLDTVLAALAHEARRHVLLVVWFHGGAMSAGEIAARFSHSWPTTSRHLRVLEEAGLLRFDKQGRTRTYRVNDDPLRLVSDWLRWFQQPAPAATDPAAAEPAWAVLRNIALAYPEAGEDCSANERLFKVAGRPFLILRPGTDGFELLAKLPKSRDAALSLSFVEPVKYRLGRSDWVAARFGPEVDPPVELLWEWIDEGYRSSAPKRLLAGLAPPPTAHRPGRG